MMHKSWRLAAVFSIVVFVIMSITMIVLGSSAMLLIQLGIIRDRNPMYMIFIFMVISVIVGTVLSRFGGRRMIDPILEINEATKEIADGNFDIQITQDNRVTEVNEMAQNFNLMAQELKDTEIFHNDFINNVSHEFKTPLSAIEGYATLLQNPQLSEAQRQAYVEKILFNSKRLTSLTGNILQLTRLENQNIITDQKLFSLDEQLRENVLLYQDTWTNNDIEMNVELAEINYFGNEELLSQVWQNLIGNAVKFVRPSGFIDIKLYQDAHDVVVSVSDNGIGMSEQVQQRIFDKFYQGDTSHSVEGNGLGLSLSSRIVALHEGTIAVSSKEGKGTTFTVKLPIRKAE